MKPGVEISFRERVEVTDECWIWKGGRTVAGYGIFSQGQIRVYAHRFALEQKIGRPLASGENACHTCDNPPCVNPDHLYAGSQRQNIQDAVRRGRHRNPIAAANAKKSHCSYGHEFTEENTRIRPNGSRACRKCAAQHQREYLARLKGCV